MKIKELLDRYELKNRQSIYNWCKAVNIQLAKDLSGQAYATAEQIALLDQLSEHLKGGGKLDNFTPVSSVSIATIDKPIDREIDSKLDTPIDSQANAGVYRSVDSALDTTERPGETELFLRLIEAVSGRRSPIDNLKDLLWLSEQGLIVSSEDVERLIGVKPHGERFVRGSFAFIRAGKVGNQLGWRVERA